MKEVRECYLCHRRGERGFHRMLRGDISRWRCDSSRACDDRQYRNFMGLK